MSLRASKSLSTLLLPMVSMAARDLAFAHVTCLQHSSFSEGMEMECQQDRLPFALCKVMASLHDLLQSVCIRLMQMICKVGICKMNTCTIECWMSERQLMQGGAEYCRRTSMHGRWTQIPLLQLWSFGPRQLGQRQKVSSQSFVVRFSVQELETVQEVFRSCRSAAQGCRV